MKGALSHAGRIHGKSKQQKLKIIRKYKASHYLQLQAASAILGQ